MIDHNEAAAARHFEEPFIFPEEDELLGVLEDAGVPSVVNDKAVAILRRVLEREANANPQPPTPRKGCIYPEFVDCPKLQFEDGKDGRQFRCPACDFDALVPTPFPEAPCRSAS